MKKILKKLAALGCAFVAFTAPFGCARPDPNPNPNPEIDPPNPPIVQPVETEQDKAEKLYNTLVDSMKGGNFTLENGNKTYKFAKDKAEIDGGFYFSENGRDVYIADGVKDFTELSVAAAKNNVVAQFDGVEFDNFENGVLSGSQADGDKVSVTVSADKIELTVNGHTLTASNIGTTTVNIPTFTEDKTVEKPPVEKTLQEAVSEINAFLDGVKQSQEFTYTKTENSNVKKYSFLNGLMKVEKDGAVRIYEEEGENKYVYSQQNGAWNKDFTDKSIADALESFDTFVTGIKNASWNSFEANQLSGMYDGKNVTAKLEDNTLEMNVDDKTVTISENVESFAKPAQVTDNTIQSEKLWENDGGQRVYNYKLLAQTLEDWIKENDAFLTEISRSSIKSVDKLLTLEIKDDSLKFKTLVTNSSEKPQILDFEFHPTFFASILTDENDTANKMKECFSSLVSEGKWPIRPINSTKIDLEYSSLNATPEQKTEMEGLTQRVFNKLATEGWKESNREQPNSYRDLRNTKILFYGRSELELAQDGLGLGNKSAWHQYYLVDDNGEIKWLDTCVASATYEHGAIGRVLGDTDNLWFVLQPVLTPVDKGNSELYKNVDLLKTSAKTFNL